MELHEKLQILRKEKGLTQEELAEKLYVSRTAVSKWESGRGYPSIDSLKEIAGFYSISIDELLSADKVINICSATVGIITVMLLIMAREPYAAALSVVLFLIKLAIFIFPAGTKK